MAYRLFDFAASPFCLKIRALLDYKGVAFKRVPVTGPAALELRRRGRIGKVPALDMDGELVTDSTDIAYALEARHPTPPALPATARDRAWCHVLEDWADESLYYLGDFYRWVDPAGRAGAGTAFPGPALVQRAASVVFGRRAAAQLRAQGLGRKPRAHVDRDLDRQLEHAAALLDDRPFLLGDAPMLCDFAVAAQLVYLRRTPAAGPRVEAYPALTAFLERVREIRHG